MPRVSLVNLIHNRLSALLHNGDTVIDATAGNGNDTCFLAEKIAPDGLVYGFDIQAQALDKTRIALDHRLLATHAVLINASHAHMKQWIHSSYVGQIKAVLFNLGYLPGGDKTVITTGESTLAALAVALELISADGIISILAYPGHAGGRQETDRVREWCLNLDSTDYSIETIYSDEQNPQAPILFWITARPQD
ncbi:MAG: class I SAM-dependent methyltransferase [Methylicorpusculum sp.]|uniref:class I SAM-dependent methyltransferase n=1 Tax=Methylicorpusculum sp. TaxID=2713644 RepID=UPI00271C3FD7|nr:class I SAM-dependent methyltransferase [Methylicorpusculum sp.]MDO8937923.1 class I SAM-dependent methyltransferase [Methylicorpusculum sp.]MDO9241654.1 class I SAM-dependent methyltransferase [Methylicorpusculum sp.]MDP2203053.1 class I SAM-dependent methyltransferase [Methylicorpusculum sp.]